MTLADLWRELGTIVVVCSFGGAIVYAILRTKFITIEECENSQTKCSMETCKKIDKLGDQLAALRVEFTTYVIDSEKRRDEAKDKLTEQLSQIRIFMARIDQKIKDDRWEDLK